MAVTFPAPAAPRRSRIAVVVALAIALVAALGVGAAPTAAGAAATLEAPVVGHAYAGAGQTTGISVFGPPGAVVDVTVVESAPDGGECTKAMTGPGVTPVITKRITLDATSGFLAFVVDGAMFTAGRFVYATATSGDTTTAVGNCLLLGAGPPQDVRTQSVTATSVTARWTPTAGASGQYARLLRRSGEVVQGKALEGTTSSVTFDGLGPSYLYTVSVTSVIYPGDPPPDYGSQLPQFVLPPFTTPQAMTAQQFLDVLGRKPTAREASDWYLDLTGRGTHAKVRVDHLLSDPRWDGVRNPVIRVYRAALGRWPDAAGLTYWADRHRGGTSVRMIGTVFTQSSEFQHRYGALTNRDFVKRIYLNVLGRQPDRGGLDYWTRRLDVGGLTRGELVLQFSTSDEFVNQTGDAVGAIEAYTALVRRMPTASELSTWGGIAAPPRTEVIAHLFGTAEYGDRITR